MSRRLPTPVRSCKTFANGAALPVYAHVPDVNGNDGKKLSKRHGAVSIDVFRTEGYLPAALMNDAKQTAAPVKGTLATTPALTKH